MSDHQPQDWWLFSVRRLRRKEEEYVGEKRPRMVIQVRNGDQWHKVFADRIDGILYVLSVDRLWLDKKLETVHDKHKYVCGQHPQLRQYQPEVLFPYYDRLDASCSFWPDDTGYKSFRPSQFARFLFMMWIISSDAKSRQMLLWAVNHLLCSPHYSSLLFPRTRNESLLRKASSDRCAFVPLETS